jgi:DNA polymerase elongation subunit (family B)
MSGLDLTSLSDQELDELEKKFERERSRNNSLQMVSKVVANSSYGTMASPYFRLFDVRVAEAITLTGQLLVQWVAQEVNIFLNNRFETKDVDYVCAQDTDSAYLTLSPLTYRQPDKLKLVMEFCEYELTGFIDDCVRDLEARMGVIERRWVFKQETICDRAVWTGKKRYCLNMLVSEAGKLSEPEIKITGIEAVRSTTPEWAREKIKAAIKVLMREDEKAIQQRVKELRVEFMKLAPEELAMPVSASKLSQYATDDWHSIKGTPQHIKATINYNRIVTELKLTDKYNLIAPGEKVKVLNLVEPNPCKVDTIAFTNFLPEEFEVEAYINRAKMFERIIVKPLERIANAMGWTVVKRPSLKGFLKISRADNEV